MWEDFGIGIPGVVGRAFDRDIHIEYAVVERQQAGDIFCVASCLEIPWLQADHYDVAAADDRRGRGYRCFGKTVFVLHVRYSMAAFFD